MKSNRAVSPRRAASRCSKRTFARPSRPASARAAAIPASEKSKPVNRDRGNAPAIRLTAWPDPHPTSATSIPSLSRSVSPGTSGSVTSIRVASWTAPLSSAMTAWNLGNAEYGTPPPCRKQSTIWSSTCAISPMYCIPVARFAMPAARVSQAACSAGSE